MKHSWLKGVIKTGYKTNYWDSEKEYKEFWSKSKHQPQDQKKKKNRKWPWILLLILLCVVAVGFVWLSHKKESDVQAPKYIESEASASIVDSAPDTIPEYTGEDVIELNSGKPCFTELDFNSITGENYTDLDRLGRCGTAVAMLDRTMMPTETRSSIGAIKPSGWVQEKYPGIVDSEPPYLYNRCHLIAYAMTGQNANELNLITGTRYMNATTMLPYEEQVLRYLDYSDNHVLYRVSPYFKGSELVARGVEIEAYSVEDKGAGVCFHVFIYNVQPGIEIDYSTGNSKETTESK